jgi:uncharacterized protein HemX
MLTRSCIATVVALAFSFAGFAGAQARSNNHSHNDQGATNHQASSGSSQSAAKKNGQATKKKVKPAVSDITITKKKDQASPQ